MKKVMNSAVVYFILAMVAGVFYREFTKMADFTGQTSLGVLHTHLLILGTGVGLLLAFVFKKEQPKHFNGLFLAYNVSLSVMICTMLMRGIVEVQGVVLNSALDASLSGVAGLSHGGMAVCLLLFLLEIRKKYLKEMGGN